MPLELALTLIMTVDTVRSKINEGFVGSRESGVCGVISLALLVVAVI